MNLKAILTCLLAFLMGTQVFAQKMHQDIPNMKAMTKVYVMKSCPDCDKLKRQLEADDSFEVIDISTHVRKLKEFIRLRDTHPAFEEVRKKGSIGIPCFVSENGVISFDPEEVGLKADEAKEAEEAAACNLDGSGC